MFSTQLTERKIFLMSLLKITVIPEMRSRRGLGKRFL